MAEEIESRIEDGGSDGAEGSALNDIESVTDFFDSMDGEKDGDSEGGADGSENGEGGEGGKSPAEGSEGEAEEQALPASVMPEGWEEAMWSGLAPEVQAHISGRAQAHAQAIAAERQAQQELKARQEQFTIQTNAQLRQALETMKHIVQGEFADTDWNGLAQSDPAMYVRLQQLYNNRVAAIRQVEQGIQQKVQAYRAERQRAEAADLENEYQRTLPEIKALVGAGYEGRKFAGEMADYMLSQGVPKEAVNGMSKGYELKLAAKAMMYDRLMNQRAAAARKVAEAPRVQTPRSAAQDVKGSRLAKARSVLSRNPNSTDAIAAVFDAM